MGMARFQMSDEVWGNVGMVEVGRANYAADAFCQGPVQVSYHAVTSSRETQ